MASLSQDPAFSTFNAAQSVASSLEQKLDRRIEELERRVADLERAVTALERDEDEHV